jgi:hypothetical protein
MFIISCLALRSFSFFLKNIFKKLFNEGLLLGWQRIQTPVPPPPKKKRKAIVRRTISF